METSNHILMGRKEYIVINAVLSVVIDLIYELHDSWFLMLFPVTGHIIDKLCIVKDSLKGIVEQLAADNDLNTDTAPLRKESMIHGKETLN